MDETLSNYICSKNVYISFGGCLMVVVDLQCQCKNYVFTFVNQCQCKNYVITLVSLGSCRITERHLNFSLSLSLTDKIKLMCLCQSLLCE